MTGTAINYWFALEPYVFVDLKTKHGLLYNTLDSSYIEITDSSILTLLEEMYRPENCGVVGLSADLLNEPAMDSFIRSVREKYMGDLYDVSFSDKKPVQFYPLLNFQKERKKILEYKSFDLGDDILSNLFEITLYFDKFQNDKLAFLSTSKADELNNQQGKVSLSSLCSFMAPVLSSLSLVKLKGNVLKYPEHKDLLDFLNQYSCTKQYYIHFSELSCFDMGSTLNKESKLFIYIDVSIDEVALNNVMNAVNQYADSCSLVFLVEDEESFSLFSDIIDNNSLVNYEFIPVYNKNNREFFETNVYLTKDDILSEPLRMKDIYRHKVLNSDDFGKISILPDGAVYANLNTKKLGNISENTIQEIIYKELKDGESWLRVRNQEPCSSCVYQWLCPSPSNYEFILGKSNLCYLK